MALLHRLDRDHLALAPLALWFGPLLFLPALVIAVHWIGTSSVARDRQLRRWSRVMGISTILIPVAVDSSGLVTPAYAFRDGLLMIQPRLTEFPEIATLACLCATALLSFIVPSRVNARHVDALGVAERRVFLQAWWLRQMLPEAARGMVESNSLHPPGRAPSGG